MNNLSLKIVSFYDQEFTQIKAIRRLVFQIEQGVDPALDFDEQDQTSEQIVAYLDNQPVGTARIRYWDKKTAKIERLAVLSTARRQGIGKKIMEKALDVVAKRNIQEVLIYAQEYVRGLHQQFGFEQEGEIFEEAGIPHVKMRKKLRETS
jgi:predicted GNAT family N-acyltransferase